ncbi:hypothetical protein GCM10028807_62820 [Spirosoma daeguense]
MEAQTKTQDYTAILSTIPTGEIVSYLKRKDFIVVADNELAHTNNDIESALENEGYIIVHVDEYVSPEDRDKVEIRLTGSLVDADIKEGIENAFQKHGYTLGRVLQTI